MLDIYVTRPLVIVTVLSFFVCSPKKLKAKEERKLWRKQERAALSITNNELNNLKIEDETEKGAEATKQCKLYSLLFTYIVNIKFPTNLPNVGINNRQN